MTSAEKKAAKEADKVGPYGSISYWENIAKKANEIIEKTPSDKTGILAQQNAIKLNAESQAEAIRKQNALKSFDEEIDEKKKQYALYQQWVEAYGQQSADAQFSKLKESGQSFVDFLNAQIKNLENERDTVGTLSTSKETNLGSLLTQRDEATGKKQAIDVFRESLQKAGQDAVSLTDYLTELKKIQASLDQSDNSDLGIKKRLEVSQQINAVEADRKRELATFLVAVEGSEAQRYAITKRYADLRAELETQYKNKQKDASYFQANADISTAENAELDDFKKKQAEASAAFKELNKVVDVEGRKALQLRIVNLKAYLVKLEETVGKESDIYKAAAKELGQTTVALDADKLDTFGAFAQLAGGLGDALAEANGELGTMGRILATVSVQANLVMNALNPKKGADGKIDVASAISTGIQGITSVINALVRSSEQRKQADLDYYNAVSGQQREYNLLLNDQLRLRSQNNESVFVKDYEGRLKDGVDALSKAQEGYQATLKKLQAEGKGKSGLKTQFDGKTALDLIGGAAATGAVIGSIIPGIGTVVGGLVGGIVGGITSLFGGASKKVEEFSSLVALYPTLIQKGANGVDELNVSLAQTLINQGLVDEATKGLLQSTIDWTKQIDEARNQIKEVISELAGSLGNDLRDGLVDAFKSGADAATAFGKSVSKILEGLLSQMIFSKVLGPALKQLEDDMTASISPGGDNNWIDDFGKFFGQSKQLTDLYTKGLQDAQDAAKGFGIDIFGQTGSGTSNNLQGAIKGVSEETASLLAGNITAIRITQALVEDHMKVQIGHLAGIEVNTARIIDTNDKIDRMIDRLDRMYNGGVLAGTFK